MNVSYKHVSFPVKKKEIYSSKLLISPYYGCTHNCIFCPANNGFLNKKVFNNFMQNNEVYVVDNILDHIENMVDKKSSIRPTLHISPVADPFQPAESIFGMSEKIVEYCADNDMNLAICTKGKIPAKIISNIVKIKQVVFQISIYTLNEEVRKKLIRGNGATVSELIEDIEIMMLPNVRLILRIDPIFPYITDDLNEFRDLALLAKKYNAECVLSSIADITPGNLEKEQLYLETIGKGLYSRYQELYRDEIKGRLHADITYRRNMFARMKQICTETDIPFGITWEPDLNGCSICAEYSDSSIITMLG
jgi:DNA repair photolyase